MDHQILNIAHVVQEEDRDKDLENEVMHEVLNATQEEDHHNSADTREGKKEQLKWTDFMDEIFVQAMITEKDKGNSINGTFTSQAYINMIEELNTKLQMNFIKNHLKNHLKTLKEHFSQWYDMFQGTSLSGFSWNSNTQLIEAKDESKPDAVMLKTKKVSNYYEMLELFAKDKASGAYAETAKERNARLQKNDNIKVETIKELDDLLAANELP
ncbi:hypothetical protein E3N88_29242 [Mikania micrantha]|uniref:Myb/SANT-like domain-containing protein n=1 Tax=Mikania micrantha TaxID=192012 RepID=A0A5N6MJ64_9ASTR|nr:hypothetical protein E3N88_29242 [Mikania micrantha]